MKLSDTVFNASDEFHAAQLRPLYRLMLKEGYGHIDRPRCRCEVDNSEMSVIELNVSALTPNGDLIYCLFDHNERNAFQKLTMPVAHDTFIVYLEQSTSEFESFDDKDIPYRENKLNLIFKPEQLNYSNPDAVAVARFEYKQCWVMDNTFIPPCITLKANADLWNLGHSYSRLLQELCSALRDKATSELGTEVVAMLPTVLALSTEVRKEMDLLSPKHLVTIMQQVIGVVVAMVGSRIPELIPDLEACVAFTEAEYVSTRISPLVEEGIRLTQLLLPVIAGLRQPVAEPEPAPATQLPTRIARLPRPHDISSERKSFKNRK